MAQHLREFTHAHTHTHTERKVHLDKGKQKGCWNLQEYRYLGKMWILIALHMKYFMAQVSLVHHKGYWSQE